jgi:hypothetical protein
MAGLPPALAKAFTVPGDLAAVGGSSDESLRKSRRKAVDEC